MALSRTAILSISCVFQCSFPEYKAKQETYVAVPSNQPSENCISYPHVQDTATQRVTVAKLTQLIQKMAIL